MGCVCFVLGLCVFGAVVGCVCVVAGTCVFGADVGCVCFVVLPVVCLLVVTLVDVPVPVETLESCFVVDSSVFDGSVTASCVVDVIVVDLREVDSWDTGLGELANSGVCFVLGVLTF